MVLEIAGILPMNVGLFTDNSGSPGQILAMNNGAAALTSTTGFAPSTNRNWFGLPIARYLTAGTYWIAVQTNDSTSPHPDLAYDGSGGDKYIPSSGMFMGEGGGSVTGTSNKYSIRASILT